MKQRLLLIVLLFLYGCSDNSSKIPSHRLSQPGINLSYVTPSDWYNRKIPGNNYLTVYTEIDYGIHPNIQVEKVEDKAFSFESFIQEQQATYKDYTIIKKSKFMADNGKIGERVESKRKNPENIPFSLYHYYFVGREKAYIITAICPMATVTKYTGSFDSAIKTIEFE